MLSISLGIAYIFLSFSSKAVSADTFKGTILPGGASLEAIKHKDIFVSSKCAKEACIAQNMKNNASAASNEYEHCKEVGGKVLVVRDASTNSDVGYCKFQDNSFIGTWDLFQSRPK